MLYKLEIENFFSIRDAQVLNLSVDSNVSDPEERYANIFPGSDTRAPKVVAVFGANASGKTTVLRALAFLVSMIRDSVMNSSPGFVGCERFNDRESTQRPIRLAIELGGAMNLTPELMRHIGCGEEVEYGIYRYEIEIEVRDGILRRIANESLRQKPNGRGKWQRVFDRDAEGRVRDSRSFSLSGYHHLVKTLADNHTVLSSFAKFQHPEAMLFVAKARDIFFHIDPAPSSQDNNVIAFLREQPQMLSRLGSELSRIDVGVEGLRFQESPNGPVLLFKHAGLQHEMPWLLESNGTRAFIKMFPFILGALERGGIVAIDEMDAAIHPVVLPELLRWFYDKRLRNTFDAQLWLSCHSASLLDDLQKEEIAVCEKDRQGRTRVYSLMDMQVRRDDNHYRKYLSGAYGGIPYLG